MTDDIEARQKQKKITFRVIAVATLAAIVCCILRFVPAVNDTLSGRPEYMRWIADRIARSLPAQVGEELPVIAMRDDKHGCREITSPTAFDPDVLVYVVRYSEVWHALCISSYAKALGESGQDDSVILDQSAGHNYSRKLTAPVKVAPVTHVLMIFPVSYLSLLHWRADISPSSMARAGNAQIQRSVAAAAPLSPMDASIDLDFLDLRAAVAQRHNTINAWLTSLIFLSFLLISAGMGRTWILYRKFRHYCLPYDPHVRLWTFLRHDLEIISEHAQSNYHARQQQAVEQARAVSLLRRAKEATRERLESLSDAIQHEEQRRRILESLRDDDLDRMNTLLQELESQFGQKTPEERLAALLESVKPYCTSKEFDQCRIEAFEILAALGFREARSFVIRAHDRFRARSKESEKEEIKEAGERLQGSGDR